MNSQSVRSLALPLIVLTVSAAGWPGNVRSKTSAYERSTYADSARSNPAQSGKTAVAANKSGGGGEVARTSDGQSPSPAVSATGTPILPFIMEYEYGKQYFVEKIYADPVYIGIEAMFQEGPTPVYQVLMTEKEGHRKVYYTNSEARAALLTAAGKTAHITVIKYSHEESLGEEPKHIITLTDEKSRAIRWTFVQANDLDEETRGVSLIARPLKVLYRDMASMAGEGTSVQIGDLTDKPKERPDLKTNPDEAVYEGTLCVDPIIGGLVSGTQTWQVKSAPKAIEVGAQWLLMDDNGYSRHLRITAKRGNQITIQEDGVDSVGSSPMTMIMNQTPEGFSLSSVTYSGAAHQMRLTFVPDLDIAAVLRSGKKSSVEFQLDLGAETKAVAGILDIEKKLDQIELTGHAGTPDWAQSLVLKSRVAVTAAGYKIECEKVAPAN
jgi:hypothetical protein